MNDKSIKGGKESDIESIYQNIGELIGGQKSIQKNIESINNNLDNLWTKYNSLQQTTKEAITDFGKVCPARIKIDNMEEDRRHNTIRFRWLVGILLSIITIALSIIAYILK